MKDEYGPDLITLTDEDGVETEFELLDSVEYEDRRFVALIPAEISLSGEEDLYIFEVLDENGEDVLVTLEDEELYNELYDIFSERLDEGAFYEDGGEGSAEDPEDESEDTPEQQ